MRRAAKVDSWQRHLTAAMKKIGAKVRYTHTIGEDFPDAVVGFRGRNILLELKTPGKKLSLGQAEFQATWPGEVHTVFSVEEAVSAVVGKVAPC